MGDSKKESRVIPRGRPRNTLNVAAIFEKTLKEKVTIEDNGQTKTVTKMEAAVKHLVDKASLGDMNAFRILAVFVQSSDDEASCQADADFHEADRKILEELFLRFEASPAQEAKK